MSASRLFVIYFTGQGITAYKYMMPFNLSAGTDRALRTPYPRFDVCILHKTAALRRLSDTWENRGHSADVCVMSCHSASFVRPPTIRLITRVVSTLGRSLAYTFSAVVVVTNQVTTSFSSASGLHGGSRQNIASHTNSSSREGGSAFETEVSGGRGDSYIIPALGNTWHHCVSNRLILEQHESHREMHLTKSPLAPAVSCRFVVEESGLQEVGGRI